MTGPAYPLSPAPGSNAAGSFEIGVSPVGTIPAFNFWDTVLSQYANNPQVVGIISTFNQGADQTQKLDEFYSNIWDISTATGYGLDLLGRIIGITRNITVDTAIPYFSFDDPNAGFDNPAAPVYTPGNAILTSSQVTLGDYDYRFLLLAKAALNIGQATGPGIMSVLNSFFNHYGANIFINELYQNPLNFTLCQSGVPLSTTNLAILVRSVLNIRPPGTSIKHVVTTGDGPLFGFDCENQYVSGFDVGYIDTGPVQYLVSLT